MFKILLALLLMTSSAWATQWRAGTGENTILGISNAADIDYNSFNSIVQPLDNLLATYCQTYLTYTSATTITASIGSCVVSNSQGTIRLFLQNTSTTAITSANIDSGSLTSGTTYYVYSTAATNAATSATYYFSASNSAPSGQTYYYQIGSFTTDGSNNISAVFNNSGSTSYVGTATSKTIGVVYQALTDGFVNASCVNSGSQGFGISILLGTTSSPATTVCNSQDNADGTFTGVTCSAIIPKGDYYEASASSCSGSQIMYFTPTSK